MNNDASLTKPVAWLRWHWSHDRSPWACSARDAGLGAGAGALLLEVAVGRECRAADRQLDQRQHEPVRSGAHS